MSRVPEGIPAVWAEHAGALADWTNEHLVNRRDAFGHYIAVEDRGDPDLRAFTDKGQLTLAVLQRHFQGESTGDIIGLHSTVRDEAAACWSRWLGVDIDCHDDSVDPAVTWKAAKTWYERTRELGFHPLLLDSNGQGGYHLLLIFDGPVATGRVHHFGQWLTRDWKELGLGAPPEIFPKQESIEPGRFGNWLRLPGRHHTRDHFTRVWDGSTWLEGTPAIKAIVRTKGTPGDKIPAEATEPEGPRAPKRVKLSANLTRDVQLAQDALPYVQHLAGDYDDWIEIGLCLTPLDAEGLALWDDWSQSCPEKYDEGACERKWRTFTPEGGLTLGTLFHRAKANGWPGPNGDTSARRLPISTSGDAQPPEATRADAPDDSDPESACDRDPTITVVEKGPTGGDREKKKEEESQAQVLLRLALASGVVLFHTPDQKPFATIPAGDHWENHPIRSTSFKRWLVYKFYIARQRPPSSEALQGAINALEAKAQFEGPTAPVWIRVAELLNPADPDDPTFYLDLCNDRWQVVEITKRGWQVLDESPVKFRRTQGMLPLPVPAQGGTLDDLRGFVNIPAPNDQNQPDSDWMLFVAVLTAGFRPYGPYPLLEVTGEQGAAKSTTSRVFRSAIDPHKTLLRSTPKEDRDLMISANNCWCQAFDNLSRLPEWLSDALCRQATGGGFSTRALYTDDEEIHFDTMRPVVITGIASVVERDDLGDRLIRIVLPTIPDDRRREEKPFWRSFEVALPRILGALLDAVAGGLKRLPDVHVNLPRMADFGRWGVAVGRALDWQEGAFLKAYAANRNEASAQALEDSAVATALCRFMQCREDWEGIATEMLAELAKVAGEAVVKDKERRWPKTGRGLTGQLRRLAPLLRKVGIELLLDLPREGKESRRVIGIRKSRPKADRVGKPPSAPSAPSAPPPGNDTTSYNGNGLCQDDKADGESLIPSANRRPSSAIVGHRRPTVGIVGHRRPTVGIVGLSDSL